MLNISNEHRQIIVDELLLVAKQMQTSPDARDKMYFLSASWAMIQRVFNIEYDPELVFAWQVLNLTYQEINGRVTSTPQSNIMGIVPAKLIEGIEQQIGALAEGWGKKTDVTNVLQRLAELGYAATGNGNYLVLKGMLPL